MCKTVWAVAALTVAAAFAVQHHRHRKRTRAMRAQQIAERLAAQRAHEAFARQVYAEQERAWAGELVVEEAARVVDDALADEEIEGTDGDE